MSGAVSATLLSGACHASAAVPPALAFGSSAPGYQAATNPASAAASGASEAGLDDIVVTATRREERLQKVPISITVIGGDALVRAGVTQASGLTQVVPGLNFSRLNAIFQLQIRGVGSRTTSPGDESSVAIYVDGVYQPESFAGSFDLLKVARTEVLRGPQGTLFGRNATGGLINIITPDSQFAFLSENLVQGGSFGQVAVQTYTTGALSDRVAVGVGARVYDNHGYVRNIVNGKRTGDRTSYALRGKMLFQAAPGATFILISNYLKSSDSSAVAFQPIARNTRGLALQPAVKLPSAPYQTALSIHPAVKVNQWGVALQGRFDVGGIDLETTSNFQKNKLNSFTDGDASLVNISLLNPVQRSKSYAQEIRLLGGSDRLRWIAGVYGFHSDASYDPIDSYAYPLGVQTITSLTTRNQTRSLAGFAEGTLPITDQLKAVAGIRYTYEDRRLRAGVTGVPITTNASRSDKRFTPRFIIQYLPDPDINIYASYSEGFKSGVFNTSSLSPVSVRPEIIKAYEAGFKSQLGRQLRLNISAFHYDYTDLQSSVRDPIAATSLLQNAVSARIDGGEAELEAAVLPGLTFRGGLALLKARFGRFLNALVTVPTGAGGNRQSPRDVSGNDLTRSPRFTASIAADFRQQVGSGMFFLTRNLFYSAKYYWDNLNRIVQRPGTQINATVAYELSTGFLLSLSVENLLDQARYANVNTTVNADYATYQMPRRLAITLGKTFR